jgi:hypothetical protein
MNQPLSKTLWIALTLASLFMVGCASQRINWNSRVGSYTFDQAVTEIGPPDKQAKTTDGTLVAEWLTHRGYAQTYNTGWYNSPSYGYYAPPTYVNTYSPDYFLRLTFGPDGKLQSWKKFSR